MDCRRFYFNKSMSKNLLAKYIWEVSAIHSAGHITLRGINDKWTQCYLYDGLPIPRRTFDRHRHDIETLFDINISCRKSDNTYYIEDHGNLANDRIRHWLLNNFAVGQMLTEAHAIKDKILFEEIPSGYHWLLPAIQAMRERRWIIIRYHSFQRIEEETLKIIPLALKISHQRWYIVTRKAPDQVRVYALDRILEMQITDEKFDYPSDFSAEEYFENCYGIIAGQEKAETVRLKVMHNQQKFFRSLPLHHSQKETESTESYSIFEYYIKPAYDFKQTILSYGENVEVLSPKWLRDEIADKISRMTEIYKR